MSAATKGEAMPGNSTQDAPVGSATTRTSRKLVSFGQPFTLSTIEGRQPAGSYTIETDEELVGGVSFPAYRRTATWIRLPSPASYAGGPTGLDRLVNVDPAELEAALADDVRPLRNDAAETLPDSGEASGGETRVPDAEATATAKAVGVQQWVYANITALTWVALVLLAVFVLGFSIFVELPRV
jgi:hypothetical protein